MARSMSASFAKLLETAGMLTIHHSNKVRAGFTVTDALCKMLNWYFAVLAKMRINSVEALIYRKYPYVCPYCLVAPHEASECKKTGDIGGHIDKLKLEAIRESTAKRPSGLDAWQRMFKDIYPPPAADRSRNMLGLFEELGELAEAVRVFDKKPGYFAGEAADTFSYLMCIANEHSERHGSFSFQAEFLSRYPGMCLECGARVCVCPAIPEATIGRMAKEEAIGPSDMLFGYAPDAFEREGNRIALRVRKSIHGVTEMQLPFDRGEVNNTLVALCLLVADAICSTKPECAEHLQARALETSIAAQPPGSRPSAFNARLIVDELKWAWRSLNHEQQVDISSRIRSTGGLLDDICHIIATV